MRRRDLLVVAVFGSLHAFVATPLPAAPANPRITAIYDAIDCRGTRCDTDAPAVSSNQIVSGPIQIQVHAEDPLGLRWVRLEASFGDRPDFLCVQEWDVRTQTRVDEYYTWDTLRWPEPGPGWGCGEIAPHFHGQPTTNDAYDLRIVAANYVDEQQQATSPRFPLRLANAPVTPTITEPPTASGRKVRIGWKPSRERDILEYRIVRANPGGGTDEFAVSAESPEQQACTRIGAEVIRCVDSSLPDEGGTYTYAVLALRPGAGATKTCALSSRPCIESPISETRTVSVAAAPSGGTGGPSGSSDPTGEPSTGGTPTDEPPSDAPGPVSVDTGDRGDDFEAAANDNNDNVGGNAILWLLVVPLGILVLAVALTVTGTWQHILRRRRPID